MSFSVAFVAFCLVFLIGALIADRVKPGLVLFTCVIAMLCAGILQPKECLEGFSNKGMITVGLLFLISEGIRRSGLLEQIVLTVLPNRRTTETKANARLLPAIAAMSAFLNNTPVVVIFAPIIKSWAKKVDLSHTKFLIPLSYATILGGICTLIGTSTNLVVDGLIQETGREGMSMFEIGKVGIIICLAGLSYLIFYSHYLLPDSRKNKREKEEKTGSTYETEPGLSNWKRYFAVLLLVFMVVGATIGELPAVRDLVPGFKFDMFFFACLTTIIMAWTKIFNPNKYSKYVSWDVLVTIACAFAISKGMQNSGFADQIADLIIACADAIGRTEHGPYAMLAILFLITNLFTELITNNAAAALSFPLALAVAEKLGVDPMPFFICICIAASAAFSTPIGYQTNLLVQGIGGYRFTDYVKVGLPLNIIVFLISIFIIPMIWPIR